MSENQLIAMNQILNALPGGILRIVMDDELTIVDATDTFYKLTDMDSSKSKLPKSIFKTVYSADIIYYTRQIAAQKRRKDNQLLLFYRVLQKNGNLKWIMINGSKADEEYQKQGKALPVYICIASDMTEHMMEYRKTTQELDYHQTILELSKELFFEYVIATDTLIFSELFREVFGKESEIKEFGKKLEKTKMIHPADLKEVINIYKSMMSGKKQARIEFRMTAKDGETYRYVCYASIIFDDNKNPYKAVGKLSLVHTNCDEDNKPDIKIQHDPLTKVYTKDTAEHMITESISVQKPESVSAFFMCEVRNYKGLNDVAGMMDGENILTSIAGLIKRYFRSTDIIGRMGLGDFVVYMKDITSDRNVYQTAEYICREVNRLYNYDFSRNGAIINIGVVFVKGEAEYGTVSANAKAALVMAKKESTSSFEVFNPSANNKS